MKIQITKISKKLKNLREQRKLTQEELAKKLGVSRQSIIALEQGRCLPSLPLAIGFAQIFETPLERIFCEVEVMHHNIRKEVNSIMSNDLSPWSPMKEASQLHESIDRLFTPNLENWPQEKNLAIPMVNVYEKGDSIILEADVPGVKDDDLSIEVGDDTVTISGERKSESEINEENYYRKETIFGQFVRSISLPAVVDEDKSSAELRDGRLIVTLPKKSEIAPKVTRVKIKKTD